MFRRKKNITCETKDEIICFNENKISPVGSSERLKELKLSENVRKSLSPISKQLNPRESLSPKGARVQKSGSFEKLSGILGPEVIADIKKLSTVEDLPEIN